MFYVVVLLNKYRKMYLEKYYIILINNIKILRGKMMSIKMSGHDMIESGIKTKMTE